MADSPEEKEFDVEAGSESIAADLFPSMEKPEEAEEQPEEQPEEQADAAEPDVSQETKGEQGEDAAPEAKPVPSTWPKEMHEYWAKLDPKVQEYHVLREEQMFNGLAQYKEDAGYGRALKEVLTPYKATIAAQGVDEPTAVKFLLNAHYRLSTAPEAERAAYFADLAKSYHIDLSKVPAASAQPALPPEIKTLQERLDTLQSTLMARDSAASTEQRARVEAEVNKFASDPAHPYFDDVADDIIAMLRSGAELKDAYDKAVWANPVTRAKEIARLQTENEAKSKDKAKKEAEAARKAASTNVRGRDTKRTPTESLGTMEDTMKATLAEIQSRTH